MKSTRALEPGLLPTFRLFVGIELVITALVLVHWFIVPFPLHAQTGRLVVYSLLQPGLLFIYLSSPALQHRLKSLYLPVAIIWAVAGPVLDPYTHLINLHTTENTVQEIVAQAVLWRQMILLLIPLIVVSWQYKMRQVLWFCELTMILNIAILSFQGIISTSLLGITLVQTIVFFLVGQMIVRLMQEQRQQRQHLTAANARLAHYASALEQLTISRERNRMARELHDVLAHTLSGVAVELEGSRAMLRLDPERASTLLNHSLQAIREGLTKTRRALKELRAKPLEDVGLALAVRMLAESYASQFGFSIELEIEQDLDNLPAEIQQCVYRIAQETLTNVGNHAQAQKVQVSLKQDNGQLHLSIRDDGCGFDLNLPAEEYHYGLLGIRERADLSGGVLAIESQIGKGTGVFFSYGAINE